MFRLKTAFLFCAIALPAVAQRHTTDLRQWQFSRDTQTWQQVAIPHDWAISGPFDKKWDLQMVAIEQNGETEATEKSGRSGALPWIGEGHYRTTVTLQNLPAHAELVFDGAMSEPTVKVNGRKAGYWAYGYNAFRLDVTSFLQAGQNTIEVDLKNVEESSRWYPGGGLYRPVELVTTSQTHIDTWQTFARTLSISNGKATVCISAKVSNPQPGQQLQLTLAAPDGRVLKQQQVAVQPQGDVVYVVEIERPQLWTPETPSLYTARLSLSGMDETVTRFGIRTVTVSKEGGFQLNGISRKLKGVCLHHDLGPLGAAINKAALIRQIETMKAMGADAIRTAQDEWVFDSNGGTFQVEIQSNIELSVSIPESASWLTLEPFPKQTKALNSSILTFTAAPNRQFSPVSADVVISGSYEMPSLQLGDNEIDLNYESTQYAFVPEESGAYVFSMNCGAIAQVLLLKNNDIKGSGYAPAGETVKGGTRLHYTARGGAWQGAPQSRTRKIRG